MSDLSIDSLRGGYNDFDPPSALAPDECTTADNVEFWLAACGARRGGTSAITISGTLAAQAGITFLARHLPTTDESDAQLWAWGTTAGASSSLEYKDTTWHAVGFPDAPTLTSPSIYQMLAQTLHGKLFLAYASATDRLHVWDGTSLRRCGLAQPAAPAVADTAVAGTYSGTRYFRTRFTVQSAGVTLRRSEPSTTTTFSPLGTKTGAVITKPATINESETHWEVEASLNNADFYRIATVVVGTTTYTDTTSSSTGYATATGSVLSESVGNYVTIPSGRYMIADSDRLIIGGSFSDASKASHIWWTPVGNDPGVGSDERIPTATSNELDLDGYEGGPLTGFGGPINGVIVGFKWSHVYKIIRTGQITRAYDPQVVTKDVGALPGSIVRGVDEAGRAALYFLDPKTGPYRIGAGGMLWAGRYIWNTWQRLNRDAIVVSRAIFYPDKKQVHWWIAVDGSTTPSLRIVIQTNDTQTRDDGVRRGFTRHTGNSASALAACLFASNIESNAARSLSLVPMIAVGNTIQRMDTGTTDNGAAFTPRIVSSPRMIKASGTSGIIQKFGARCGAVIATAVNAVFNIRLIRNFGVETGTGIDVSTAPNATENPVIRPIDNLAQSECFTSQVEIRDGTGNTGTWALQQIALALRGEESS